jgi:hypothetical protein
MANRIAKALWPEYSSDQVAHSAYKFSFQFFLNLIWLLGATFLVYYLGMEKNKGFDKVALILTTVFLIYILVPLKFRKLFLVGLAFVVEVYLFGIKLSLGVLIVLLYFVALTYINKKQIRLFYVVVSVVLGIAVTSKFISLPHVRLIFMLSAMFLMLRYIYFLYELNYFKIKPVFIDRLCYLFLIPNACFPLFPALNPNEYQKTFYNQPSGVSFKRGLHWITVGIFHLLIYRVIYLYFTPSPYDINGFGMWVLFILSSYSLIFRLSGLFYLAMGFLQIFGFHLPNVFNHVYFASGFPDLWRRVNLYWRAFMLRVFYYPTLFKFKKTNQRFAIWFVTLFMFGCTWFLHSWQWYWIKGSYYFYPTDMLFWFTFGVIISISALRSYIKMTKGADRTGPQNYYIQALRVVLMFFIMSLLWSLWTSTSITEFLYISKFSISGTAKEYLMFLGIGIVVVLIAGVIRTLHFKQNWFAFVFEETKPVYGIAFCVLMYGSMEILKQGEFKNEVKSFISMNMNSRDKTLLERGYYEQILNSDDKAIDLMNAGGKFKKWNLDRDAYRKTDNELVKEFIPNYKTTFKGDSLYTNRFGLRDKEYSLEKPQGVTRLAFIGGSYVMGSGVSNEENFAALVENKLNKVEILNYGVGGYFIIQNVFVSVNKVPQYKPDYLFFFIHSNYRARCLDNLATLLLKGANITSPYLKTLVEDAGIKKGMCHLEIYNRLKPHIDEIISWSYKTVYESCRTTGEIPVLVYLPANAVLKCDEDKYFCISEAKKTGFHFVDLSEVYDGQDPDKIQLSAWDTHPNEKGHQLIANLLLEKLKKDEQFFKFMQ